MTDLVFTSPLLDKVHCLTLEESMDQARLVCRYEVVHLAVALHWMASAFYYIEKNVDKTVQFLPINGNFLIVNQGGDVEWARAVRNKDDSHQYSIWSRQYLKNITI